MYKHSGNPQSFLLGSNEGLYDSQKFSFPNSLERLALSTTTFSHRHSTRIRFFRKSSIRPLMLGSERPNNYWIRLSHDGETYQNRGYNCLQKPKADVDDTNWGFSLSCETESNVIAITFISNAFSFENKFNLISI